MMMEIKKEPSEIIVKKEREQEYERNIQKELKDVRRIFFTQQIRSKLNEAKISEKQQQRIMSYFMEKEKQISLNSLTKYRKEIEQLQQTLRQAEQRITTNRCGCLPIQQIIKEKVTSLTVIRIQYRLDINGECYYSIFAFELFSVIHKNTLLHQVTLKGVNVYQFQRFTTLLNRLTHNKPTKKSEKNELSWMKRFSPPQSLKLSINARVQFDFKNIDQDCALSQIDDLVFFRSLFCSLSDIRIDIRLGRWIQLNEWVLSFQKLWDCLRQINKIQIQICGLQNDRIQTQQASTVRSILFGGLASLADVTKLSFGDIKFSHDVEISDYIAIEQSLSTLFKNNTVTHLELDYCRNFPIIPKIITLEFISLRNISFRKQFGFMNEVIGANPSLRSINYNSTEISDEREQEWVIDEQLFNQLQTLIIQGSHVQLKGIFSQSPSKLRHLQIYSSNIGKVDCLSKLFPKLANLTYLGLRDSNFGHQLLCTIPSPHLEDLHILNNSTKIDLVIIGPKWPNLSRITLSNCSKVIMNVWSFLNFKGLSQVSFDKCTLGEGYDFLMLFFNFKGVKVDYYNW